MEQLEKNIKKIEKWIRRYWYKYKNKKEKVILLKENNYYLLKIIFDNGKTFICYKIYQDGSFENGAYVISPVLEKKLSTKFKKIRTQDEELWEEEKIIHKPVNKKKIINEEMGTYITVSFKRRLGTRMSGITEVVFEHIFPKLSWKQKKNFLNDLWKIERKYKNGKKR